MKKKVITAVLIIWIVGMIAFFMIPNSVLEEATTVATTIAETILCVKLGKIIMIQVILNG